MEPEKALQLFLNIETGLPVITVNSLKRNVPYKLKMEVY